VSNQTFIPYKLTKVRVTRVDPTCGTIGADCVSFIDDCIVSIEESGEYKDREEFFPENGDGNFCATITVAPKLKWLNLTLTFNDVNPAMIPYLTGDTVILDNDDTTVPNQIGYGRDYGAGDLAAFALEGWTRIAATCDNMTGCVDGTSTPLFGYTLYAWVKEGTMGDVTYANDLANFVVEAVAVRNSPWGTGPYNVVKSEATATIGQPQALFSSYAVTRFKEQILTKLPPPTTGPGCDCIDISPSLTFADSGVLMGTVTIPLRNGLPILPGYIDWGDATAHTLVTVGTTSVHTYGIAGTYTATYKPSNESGPTYTSAPTAIA